MEYELLRRLEDLLRRCEKNGLPAVSKFLTPAEQAEAAQWLKTQPQARAGFFGGHPDCERRLLFFLPDWQETPDYDAELRAVRLEASFGTPGHRDYLGALLGQGIRREWLGDIWVDGSSATVFCLPSVQEQLCELDRAGRITVRATPVPLDSVVPPEKKRKEVTFTVQSPRLDAVVSDLFRIPRTAAAKQIQLGTVSLNYLPCLKPDAPVKEGDILSLKGHGKGEITELGGLSRKGRQFIRAELYV